MAATSFTLLGWVLKAEHDIRMEMKVKSCVRKEGECLDEEESMT